MRLSLHPYQYFCKYGYNYTNIHIEIHILYSDVPERLEGIKAAARSSRSSSPLCLHAHNTCTLTVACSWMCLSAFPELATAQGLICGRRSAMGVEPEGLSARQDRDASQLQALRDDISRPRSSFRLFLDSAHLGLGCGDQSGLQGHKARAVMPASKIRSCHRWTRFECVTSRRRVDAAWRVQRVKLGRSKLAWLSVFLCGIGPGLRICCHQLL